MTKLTELTEFIGFIAFLINSSTLQLNQPISLLHSTILSASTVPPGRKPLWPLRAGGRNPILHHAFSPREHLNRASSF